MVADANKPDDFFSALAGEQKIENPFAEDEILFRDENGKIKVLKGGAILDFDQPDINPATSSPGQPPPIPAPLARPAPSPVTPEPSAPFISAATVSVSSVVAPAPAVSFGKPLNFDQEVDKIIKDCGIHFKYQEIENRFRTIILYRLKNVRDQIQTREMLLSSSLVGGMGFTTLEADRVLGVINQELDHLDNRFREKLTTAPFSELKQEAEKILQPPALPPPQIVYQPPSLVSQSVSSPLPPSPVIPPAVPVPPNPVPVYQPPVMAPGERPKIEDVRFQPKLTGPVEEIRSMTLTDFRRLAPTPEQMIEKILQRINLLEEESFSQKTQAIKAWKESEIYRLYLSLGDQSMEERKPIFDIIRERQEKNLPTLTPEEVEAVIELNQKLRY